MRETISYYKNNYTGETIEVKKIKKNSKLQGRVSIELGGEKNISEAVLSENMIRDMLNSGLLSSLYTNEYARKQIGFNGYKDGFDKFGAILLTDYEGEEDEKDPFWRGKVIGFSPVKSANTNNSFIRGSYNANDSFEAIKEIDGLKYLHYHYIYDFSEACGNGNINSVYWLPKSRISETIVPVSVTRLFTEVISSKIDIYVDAKMNYYFKENSFTDYYKANSKDIDLYINQYLAQPELDKSVGYPYDKTEFLHNGYSVDGYKYITSTATSKGGAIEERECLLTINLFDEEDSKIYDVVLDIGNIPQVKKYTDMYTGTNSTLGKVESKALAVDNEGNVFIAVKVIPDTNTAYLPTVNNDGSLIDSIHTQYIYYGVYNIINRSWVMIPNVENYESYIIYTKTENFNALYNNNYFGVFSYSYKNKGFLYINGKMLITENGLLKFNTDTLGYTEGDYISWIDKRRDLIYYSRYISPSNYLMFSKIYGITSHCKLPKTIVKTSDIPMKVKYDIYIQLANKLKGENEEFIFD